MLVSWQRKGTEGVSSSSCKTWKSTSLDIPDWPIPIQRSFCLGSSPVCDLKDLASDGSKRFLASEEADCPFLQFSSYHIDGEIWGFLPPFFRTFLSWGKNVSSKFFQLGKKWRVKEVTISKVESERDKNGWKVGSGDWFGLMTFFLSWKQL